ncbi:MAG: adenine-specific methyltransferase EcoRI family protein [Candidatus Avelusimicrobium sp.]|uniref:adenine-specific methyltransferase EcoRI family protein n=1 Tax=Candidatus Avelusimicrobium sp. TaxID=3048833 RepID=UPI003F054AAD
MADKSAISSEEYIYIVQSSLEPAKCKIGRTDNLQRRLKEYNSTTGQSKDNIYTYLFTCKVKNMKRVESDIANNFRQLREQNSREIYFYNKPLFNDYVNFIRAHEYFKKEVFIREPEKKTIVKIVKKTTPTLAERGLTRENIMTKAKRVDNDEFYTRYEDVEKEIEMYPIEIWKNKCVFCNCDDAVGETRTDKDSSAFALYFLRNFMRLGLKKLICTHYSGQMDLFHAGAKGYVFTKTGVKEIITAPRNYTGDFADPLSLQILNKEADIVCTNPPFSLAIPYWKTIINSGKHFLIISNIVNVLNTAYLPYFIEKKAWAGYNRIDKFLNPKRELVEAAGHWYTNLPIKNRPKWTHLKIVPLKEIPEKYRKQDDEGYLLFDNGYIPSDYDKVFGVSGRAILNGVLEKGYKLTNYKQYIPHIGGKAQWSRALIQKIK